MADDAGTMQQQLDQLRAAYRSGVLTTSYDGKSVTYRDSAAMREAIASLEAALGLGQASKTVLVRGAKGW